VHASRREEKGKRKRWPLGAGMCQACQGLHVGVQDSHHEGVSGACVGGDGRIGSTLLSLSLRVYRRYLGRYEASEVVPYAALLASLSAFSLPEIPLCPAVQPVANLKSLLCLDLLIYLASLRHSAAMCCPGPVRSHLLNIWCIISTLEHVIYPPSLSHFDVYSTPH
jgi:hypothetical protein